jgi:dihydrolipoamide dehydrogenase
LRAARFVYQRLGGPLEDGLWFKLRHAFPAPLAMLRSLRQPQASTTRPDPSERIVVIGAGTAALSFVDELRQAGFAKVTTVSQDQAFGGKCVNFGCMPSEFAFTLGSVAPDERRHRLAEFVEGLSADVRAQFGATGYPHVTGTVTSVEGRSLRFADGSALPFDRLVVAMGSDYPPPARVSLQTSKLVSMADFWQLPPGCRLVIYARDNAAAVSLAEVATALDMQVVVLLAGANPLEKLPAFRYFLRGAVRRGVVVHENARLIRVDQDGVSFERGAEIQTLAYDRLLIASRPVPRMPSIDGVVPQILDLDFKRAVLPRRPDILFVGDAAGYFTAAEAESQARALGRHWGGGPALKLASLAGMATTLHGLEPLAMLGAPWTFTERRWTEIDFRSLGWSRLHRQEGRLWYLFDEASARVEAIHICHARAPDLIALAALLLGKPVTDDDWITSHVHPSAGEIFKVLAVQARQRARAAVTHSTP